MLAALDAASWSIGFGVGLVLGIVLALALGRRGEAWHLDWRLRVGREGSREALCGPESDETPSGGMATARGDQGEHSGALDAGGTTEAGEGSTSAQGAGPSR